MPTIVHFDVATENPKRAKKFYESLFEWKMETPPEMKDYYLIETKDMNGNKGIGGGLGKRGDSSQKITTYFGVDSIENYTHKVTEFGGAVIQQKIPVPGWGHLAICIDTEGNTFGLWQDDKKAVL
jgi:predicted enzyme related to lactoylglutathione lyase